MSPSASGRLVCLSPTRYSILAYAKRKRCRVRTTNFEHMLLGCRCRVDQINPKNLIYIDIQYCYVIINYCFKVSTVTFSEVTARKSYEYLYSNTCSNTGVYSNLLFGHMKVFDLPITRQCLEARMSSSYWTS